jgi:hypothetical protein
MFVGAGLRLGGIAQLKTHEQLDWQALHWVLSAQCCTAA